MTKVSVLMPVYKTPEKFLKEAIESILNQTFTDFEFLIVDDCPEDKTCEQIISSFTDKRIKYLRNEVNLGISGTRNRLLNLSGGEYIAVMDHDDVSLPSRLEKQVAFLDTHPDIGVVGCQAEHFPKIKQTHDPLTDEEIKKRMLVHCCLTHPATMIRKSVLSKEPYQAKFTPAEDYALWADLATKTKFANLPEVLFRYRKFGGNISITQKEKMNKAALMIQSQLRHSLPVFWEMAQAEATSLWNIRLFNFIPLIKAVKKHNQMRIFLFGFIPLAHIKKKTTFKAV